MIFTKDTPVTKETVDAAVEQIAQTILVYLSANAGFPIHDKDPLMKACLRSVAREVLLQCANEGMRRSKDDRPF